jgi:DNA-binding MarR family transcriptional regulator
VDGMTQLFVDLVRVETRWYTAVDERLRAADGITAGLFQILDLIDSRPRCRVGDIVENIAITVGAASKCVDRLEAAGWCMRTVNPEDRRSSWLGVTPAGARLLVRARATWAQEIERLVAGVLGERDQRALARSLATLRAALEAGEVGSPHTPTRSGP